MIWPLATSLPITHLENSSLCLTYFGLEAPQIWSMAFTFTVLTRNVLPSNLPWLLIVLFRYLPTCNLLIETVSEKVKLAAPSFPGALHPLALLYFFNSICHYLMYIYGFFVSFHFLLYASYWI